MTTVIFARILLLASLFSLQAQASEVLVEPGDGTLAAAVAAADPGDVLLLQQGFYKVNTGTVTIAKSLTIRAVNRAAVVQVANSGVALTIDGAGIDVTIQGLDFVDSNIAIKRGKRVQILENQLTSSGQSGSSIVLIEYKSSEGDGSLSIIGNHLTKGSISFIYSNNAIIAANILDEGFISSSVPAWVIGNQLNNGSIQGSSFPPGTNIIGNRVFDAGTGSYGTQIVAHGGIIAGNIIRITCPDCGGQNRIGIRASNGSLVINNVIDGSGITGSTSTRNDEGINATDSTVIGNIIVDMPRLPIWDVANNVLVQNNLCFGNGKNGVCGPVSVRADPQFIDRNDYRLAADSPAIDAGPADYRYSDLNRSRNDIGAYGGPWNIAQYDAQRDPDRISPYVFPLFNADANIWNGELNVRAVGVARLR